MKWSDALLIGVFQGLAIFPGISRSGITICAGLLRGLKRPLAARFAFLVAIPAVCAAGLYEGLEAISNGTSPAVAEAALGAGVAALSGYFALKAIIKIVRRGEIFRFAYYLWIFGALAIILSIYY
jgi:undecaprenyl-diphosphatase